MEKLILLFLIISLYSCENLEEREKEVHSRIDFIRTVSYSKDSITNLCFAHFGAHGFTCVPCDSLKKLK